MHNLKTIFSLLVLISWSQISFAVVKTTSGSGSWSAGTTWTGGVAPLSGDDVVIASGHTVTLDADASGILTVSVDGGLVIGNDATSRSLACVSVTVGLSGSVTIGAFNAVHVLSIGGNLVNSGTFNMYAASGQVGDVTFTNTAAISGNSPQFNNLLIDADVTAQVAFNIEGNVTINPGKTFIGGSYTHTLAGDWTNNGTFTSTGTTIELNGGNQNINAEIAFNILNIKGSGLKTVAGNLTINGDLTIFSGTTFDLNGNVVDTYGTTVNSGGTLDVDDDANLTIGGNRVLVNNGTLKIVGSNGHPAVITLNSAIPGYFSIIQNDPGAQLFAQYYFINLIGNGGLQILNGTIDATDNLSNGTFINGAGSQYLDLTGLSFTSFDITNTNFNTGPTNNVKRTSGSGSVTFINSDGSLFGEANDNDDADPGSLIKWTNTYYSQGNSTFSNLSNWQTAGGNNPSSAALTSELSTFIIRDGHTVTLDQNIDVKRIEVGEGVSGILTLGNDATARTMTVRGDLLVKAGGQMNIGAIDAAHIVNLYGNFSLNGTVDLYNTATQRADIHIYGNTGNVSGTVVPELGSYTLEPSSAIGLGLNVTVKGNITIGNNAVLTDGGFTINLDGNISTTGTGNITSTGTLVLAGNNVAQVLAGTLNLNHLTVNGGGAAAKILGGNLTLLGNLLIDNNTILSMGDNTTARTIIINGNCTVNSGSSFIVSANNATHNLTLKGNFAGDGTFDLYNSISQSSILYIDNNAPHSFGGATSTIELAQVTFNASSNTTTLNTNLSIRGDITIENAAVLDLNSKILTTYGNLLINNGGTLEVDANAQLLVSNAMQITNKGIFKAVGLSGQPATVTRNASGNYIFVQNDAAAVFHANNYVFDYLSGGLGLTMGSIDATNKLSNGTFSNGTGGQSINLTGMNFGDFTTSNIVFNAGPTYNITRTSGTGIITIQDGSGALIGESFDQDNADPGTLVLFTYPSKVFYSKATANFNLLTNWSQNSDGTGGNPVAGDLTSGFATFIIKNGHDITLNADIDVLTLQVGQGTSGSLIYENNTTVRNVIIREKLEIQAGGAYNFTRNQTVAHTLTLYGNIVNNGNLDLSFDANSYVTLTISGASSQVSGSGIPQLGNLVISANKSLTTSVAFDINGSTADNTGVTVNTGAILNTDALTCTFMGIWINSGTLTTTGTFTFDGTATLISESNFNHLTISAGTTTIGNNTTIRSVTVKGNLSISSGATLTTINQNAANNLYVRGNITDDGTIILFRAANQYCNLYIETDQPHSFSGTTAAAATFYNLILSNNSNTTTVNLNMNLTVAALLNIKNAATLTTQTAIGGSPLSVNSGSVNIETGGRWNGGASSHTFTGNWTDNGTFSSTGTIRFGGTCTIFSESEFYNLGISGGTSTIGNSTTSQTIIVKGNLSVSVGAILYSTANNVVNNLYVRGNITNNGNITLYRAANQYCNLYIETNLAHSISGTGATCIFNGISILDNSNTLSLSRAITLNGDISVGNASTFDLNGNSLTTSGNITINAGGTFEVDALATLTFSSTPAVTKIITNNGIFRIVGTSGNIATVTRSGAAVISIVQPGASAVFHAKYYAMNYLSGGIVISNGSINATNNFSEGTFSNCAGTTMLDLTGLNFAGFTANNVVFNSGTTYNVTRTSGTGTITFSDATGALSGENYDQDNGNPGSLINWTFPAKTFYSQASGSFSTLTNWTKNSDGSGGNPVVGDITSGLATFIIKNGHTITLDQDIDVKTIQVGQGTASTLTVANDATIRNMTIREDLTIETNSILNIGNFSATHVINLYGNLTNKGTTTLIGGSLGKANINIYSTDGQIIGPNIPILNNITLIANSKITANVSLNIDGNVILNTGAIFADGGYTHTLAGDWTENGTALRSGTGTIEFDGSVTNITGTVNFCNANFKSSAIIVNATSPTTITSSFSVYPGCSFSSASSIYVGGSFLVDGSYSMSAGFYTYFNGVTAQSIDVSNASFQYLNFLNGGAANPKNITGDIIAASLVQIESTARVTGAGSHTFNNGLRVDGTCDWSGTLTFTAGNISGNVNSISLGTAAIVINGNVGTAIVGPATQLNINVSNDFTISAGYIVLNNNIFLTGTASKALTISATFSMYIRGSNNFPTGFGTYNLDPTSYVRYDFNGPQTVRGGAGLSYGHLLIQNNTKTLDGILDVNGSFLMYSTVTADFYGYNVSIAGNVSNEVAGCTFNNDQTVYMDAPDADQTFANGTYNFANFIFTNTSPTVNHTKTIYSNINVSNNLTITNTGGDAGLLLIINLTDREIAGGQNFTLGSYSNILTNGATSFRNTMASFSGTKTFDATSIVNYNLNGQQDLADGFAYGNLEFGNTGDKRALGSLDIQGYINRTGGTPNFVDAGLNHTIAGDWLLAVAYFTNPTGTITFDGVDQYISAANFYNIVISGSGTKILSGNINVLGDLTINNDVTLNASLRNINLTGNFINSGNGIFHQTSAGVTTFNSTTANQTITTNSSSNFGSITINKPTVGLQTVTANTNVDIDGTLIFTVNSAVFDITGRTLNVGGYFQFYDGTTFISTNSTVVFDGAAYQFIRTNPGLSFNHVVFEGIGEKRIGSDDNPPLHPFDVNGDFTSNGALVDASTGWGVDIYVGGNWVNTGTFKHAGHILTFDGADQSIGSTYSFNNVVFGGTGTKILAGEIATSGNITINDNVTLDVSTSNYSVTVGGSWDNGATNSQFLAHNNTVSFAGAAATITTGGAINGKRFYNLVINTSGNATLAGDLDVDNNLEIPTGSLVTAAYDVWVGGNFVAAGTFNQSNNASMLTLNATSGSKSFDPNASSTYRNVEIDASGATYILHSTMNIVNNTAVTDVVVIRGGTLDFNAQRVNFQDVNGYIRIKAGAEIQIDSAAILSMANGSHLLNEGGTLRMVGVAISPATIMRNGTTGYTIEQTSGTLYAQNYKIESTNSGGLMISGGTIDATCNLSDGLFSTGTGNAYITLTGYNFTDFTALNVTFQTGPTYNVSRNAGTETGIITFEDATGPWAGESHDQEPGNLVVWTFPSGVTWTGKDLTDNTDWNQDANWSSNTVPGPSDKIYMNHDTVVAGYTVYIKSANAYAGRLVLNAQGGAAINLILQGGYDLTTSGNVDIQTSTSIIVQSATSIIQVGGDWSNAGTFTHGNSKVTFSGDAGMYFVSSGTGATKAFYDFEINSASSTISLSTDIQVDNNLTVSNGILDVTSGNRTVNIKGNWLVEGDGIFNPQQGTVIFQGSGSQTISGGQFYNFTTSTGGTKQFIANSTISNNFTIGTLTIVDGQTFIINVGNNWYNNSATNAFTQTGAGTVNFSRSTGTQQIDNGTFTTTFNTLNFSNAGEKVFYRSSGVNGNILITSSSGRVYTGTNAITGNGGSNSFTISGTSRLRVQGAANFPSGFETLDLSSTSYVEYWADLDQTIIAATYGNVILASGGTTNRTKILSDNSIIAGTLTINDIYTLLDANSKTITLAGNLTFPTGGRQIQWGTGTLVHNGVAWQWNIDVDITGFNNLVLSGTYYKSMSANLNITGDVTVENGVYLETRGFKMIGTAGKTFTMNSGSVVYDAVVSPNVAFPEQFGTYNISSSSQVYLNAADAINQVLYSKPVYGNLTFQNTGRNITSDGVNDLNVDGSFSASYNGTDNNIYIDNGKDIYVAGTNVNINNYTPSSATRKIVLDGSNQQIRNVPGTSGVNLIFTNIVFANGGTKTLGDGNDEISISKSLTINTGVTVTCARNITFTGDTWTNSGTYTHTANLITFNSGSAQSINPGTNNTFFNVAFSGTGVKSIITKGINIDGSLTLNAGAPLDMGTLTHTLAGAITNNGIWTTSSCSLTFDGGNQTIPSFTAQDVICAGTGTKTMAGNWVVRDMTINTGVTLTNTVSNYNIDVKGNWTNAGTFTSNSGKVTFNGSNVSLTIDNNVSNFYDVEFNPSVVTNYSLQAASTLIRRTMIVRANGIVNLNSKILILGTNITTKTFTIEGKLNINEDAFLKFDNRTEQCILNVSGELILVGSSSIHPATISRVNAGVAGSETQINVTGSVQARYYFIEYLADAGMSVSATATLHATNNFSDGTWSNIRVATGAPVKRYLYLNCPDPGTIIRNITFNFSGTPAIGTHFNVKRDGSATGAITFDNLINGNLGGYLYEDDDASATTGKLLWPVTSVLTWVGGTTGFETDWQTASNWNPAVIPNSTLDVVINNATYKPVISAQNAYCKKLTIDAGGQLKLQNGYDIEINGDFTLGTGTNVASLIVENNLTIISVAGFWTKGSSGVFVHGNGSVYFTSSSGAVTISPGTAAFYNVVINNASTEFTFTGATISIDGSLTIQAGTMKMGTTPYIIYLKGNYDNIAGTFNNTIAGSIVFNGADQNISNSTFIGLRVEGTGTKTFSGIMTTSGTLNIRSTLKAAEGTSMRLSGNVHIYTGGTFNDGNQTHNFGAPNWEGEGNYVGSGTIIFDRPGNSNIYTSKFNNLTINNSGTITLMGNVSITGSINVQSNNTGLILGSYTMNSTNGLGSFTLGNGKYLYVRGANNFPDAYSSYTLDDNSRVYYDGNMAQTIKGVSYYHLYLADPYVKTLAGNTEVRGNLVFTNSTLDVSTSNYSISIGGSWYNNNANPNEGAFLARSGSVTFTGALLQYIYLTQTTANNFYNLYVDKTANDLRPNGANNPIVASNKLEILNGSFNSNGQIIYIGGDLLANTGSFAGTGTYHLNKASGTATIQTNNSGIPNLEINSASNATFTLSDGLTVNGNFTLTQGIFDAGNKAVNLGNGADAIDIYGTYKMSAGGIMTIGTTGNLWVKPSGRIEIIGISGSVAKVTGSIYYPYTFKVEGTIASKYAMFECMAANGINITGTIDLANNLSYSTFTNGVSGQCILQINNSQDLTGANRIDDVSFPTDPGGSAVNVLKPADAGNVEFYNATGIFAGENNDGDAYNRISWTGPVSLTWDGSVDNDWYKANNWTPSQGLPFVPLATTNVIIPNGLTNYPVISSGGALANNLTINQGASLYLTTPADPNMDLTIAGDFTINGVFQQSSVNDTIALSGNWTKSATGTTTVNGTVILTGSINPKIINNGTTKFYNMEVIGNSNYQIVLNTEIRNNLTITSGIFDIQNYTLTIGGNFANNATFTRSANSKVIFNATSGTKTINDGSGSFMFVDINANSGAVYQISGNPMRVYANLQVQSGKLDLNGQTLIHGDATGSDNITVTGILEVDANASLQLNSNSAVTVNSLGRMNIVGNSSSELATITRQSAGNYSLIVNSGGTLAARYYSVNYIGLDGIWLKSGAVLDVTNNFSDGTFSNGVSGGRYLKLEHNIPLSDTIRLANVTFNAGASYNVSRLSGNGVVKLIDPLGIKGSYFYEEDAVTPSAPNTGKILWNYTVPTTFWNGTKLNALWSDAENWSPPVVPDATFSIFLPDVSLESNSFPLINATTGNVTIKSLTIYSGGVLNIAQNANLTVNGELNSSGTLAVATGSTSILSVASNFLNQGTFTCGSSTLNMTAASGTSTITTGANSLYSLQISGAGTFQFASNVDINGNFTLDAGTLNMGTYTLNVAGNWTNNATTNCGTSTVIFDGTSGTQTITSGNGNSKAFYNLTKSGASTLFLATDLDVNYDINVTAGNVNANNKNIHVAGKWNSTTITGTLTNAIFTFDGATSQTFKNNNYPSLAGLILNKTAGNLTLNSSISITGNLTLTSGDIILGAYNLTFGTASTVTGGSQSSYIQADNNGQVRHSYTVANGSDFTFPIGDALNYSPFTFGLNSGNLTSAYVSLTLRPVFDAHFIGPHNEQLSIYLNRYWILEPSGISGSVNYDISYVYAQTDVVGDEGRLYPVKYSSSAWTHGSTPANILTNTLTWNGLTTFSEVSGAGDGNPMPVDLIDFNAVLVEKTVQLDWSTASEQNNSHFVIEKASNSANFVSIGTVTGAGNSNIQIDYAFVDNKPEYGRLYYRLRQVDFDGANVVSNVIEVNNTFECELTVSPNPVTDPQIWIDVTIPADQKVQVELLNMQGVRCYKRNFSMLGGYNHIPVNFGKKPAEGLYILKMVIDGIPVEQKILVQ